MFIKITAAILFVWSVALTVAFFQMNGMVNATRIQSNADHEVLVQVVNFLNQAIANQSQQAKP